MEKIKKELIKILKEIINDYIDLDIDLNSLFQKSNEKIDADYSLALFALSKELKKSSADIANDVFEKIRENYVKYSFDKIFEDVFVTGGYINFKLKGEYIYSNLLNNLRKLCEKGYGLEKFGIWDIDNFDKNINEKVLVEYSSPNVAKQFHIGHLKTTLIGNYIYRINKFLGYSVVGINHLGDYGTQFGKLIEGYKLYKDEYDFENTNPIQILNDIYVRISNICNEDEKVLEKCRENFNKLEKKDPEYLEIWQKFVELSLKEFDKIYNQLDIKFDEVRGESAYSDSLADVISFLDSKKLLKNSNGAKIVDLEEDNLGVAIIEKSNGSSIYITRDIAAFLYRIKKYDFYKLFYVVAIEQNLHFKQLFKIMEKAGINKKYIDGARHIPYGIVSLPNGKMSTRKGNVIKIEDLLEEAISRTKNIIETKNPSLDEKEKLEIAKKVGIGAVVFSNLSTQLIKDQVFIWDNVLDFSGNSGPYIQYVNVRILSILKELNLKNEEDIQTEFKKYINNIDTVGLKGENIYELIKKINEFEDVLSNSWQKCEPYILTNYLLDLSKEFNIFYSKNRILDSLEQKQNYIAICILVHQAIINGMSILGIQMPTKM